MNENALLITIKNPVKGRVKTRLAATMGEERALEIYLALLTRTRNAAQQVEAERYVFYSDFVDETDEWSGPHFTKKKQSRGDIGERMANCFVETLPHHARAVLVGSDIPGLSREILELAFEKLRDFDFVIGPAEDGGYYLIGMKIFEPAVFHGITWSTATVFEKTIQKMEGLGKTWVQLPTLSDVDAGEDWERHGWEI